MNSMLLSYSKWSFRHTMFKHQSLHQYPLSSTNVPSPPAHLCGRHFSLFFFPFRHMLFLFVFFFIVYQNVHMIFLFLFLFYNHITKIPNHDQISILFIIISSVVIHCLCAYARFLWPCLILHFVYIFIYTYICVCKWYQIG